MFHYGLIANNNKNTLVEDLLGSNANLETKQPLATILEFSQSEDRLRKNIFAEENIEEMNNPEDSVVLSCSCYSCQQNFVTEDVELNQISSLLNSTTTPLNSLSQGVIDTLLTGTQWDDTTISYSFYEDDVFNGSYYGPETGVKEVSEGIKANVRELLELVETFIDVDFVEVEETNTSTFGQIRYMLSDGPSYAYAYLPYGGNRSGDVHLKTSFDRIDSVNGFQNRPGKHGYTTLIHETFHALGLDHPQDGTVLDPKKDNYSTTVMSYDFKGNSPGTAMPYDIAALQSLYGAGSHNIGDDTYVFGSTTDVFSVNGEFPLPPGNRMKQTIWDSNGTDTLDFSDLSFQSNGYLFDLNEGGWLVANSQNKVANSGEKYYQYGTSLAYDVTMENIIVSSSDDTIVANAAANVFSGYTLGLSVGNDILENTDELDTLDLSSYSVNDVSQTQVGDDLEIALGNDGSVRIEDYYAVSEANRLNILFETTITPNQSMAIAEVGTITNLNHTEQTITLQNDYVNPVVFAQPLSYNGGDPSIVRITDIDTVNDTISFYLQEAEYKNGLHTRESFSYMVVEAGSWQLEDGTILEVGTLDTTKVADNGWEDISFSNDFIDTPVVLSQVQSNNDSEFVRTRQRNADLDGFSVTMEEEEALKNSGHGAETIGWLAIESGSGDWDGLNYQAGNTGDVVTHRWHELDLSNFATTPNLMGSIASYDGKDASGLRYREIGGANGSTIEIKIEEDQSFDSERGHTTEEVNLLAIAGSGVLTAQTYDPIPMNAIAMNDSLMGDALAIETDVI